MIGCSVHKESVGQGLRSKPAANGAQIVPRSSHFLSQIYAQGGERRGSRRDPGGRPGLLLARTSPKPTPSLQEACNSLDTTSCCFHLAFLFPLKISFLLLT